MGFYHDNVLFSPPLLEETLFTIRSNLQEPYPPCFYWPFANQFKDIVFRFIIEYSGCIVSGLRDFGPFVIIGLFLYEDF